MKTIRAIAAWTLAVLLSLLAGVPVLNALPDDED